MGDIAVSDSMAALAMRLIRNGYRFRRLRRSRRVVKPWAVSLEVTHRCVARCVMCNIWRIPRDTPSLSAADWLALLSRDLFSKLVELDITGGEPFLRPDLTDLLTAVCELKKSRLTALRSIAVTTNGFLTRRVLEVTRRVLPHARRAGVDIVMVCAMDAVGALHDAIRNYPGGWERVHRTIGGLLRLRAEFPNLIIGLKTTILPASVGQLDAIARYAEHQGLFTIISPCIITRGRYLNLDRSRDLAFRPDQICEMVRFFRRPASRWAFHQRTLLRYFRTGRMKKPCTCGFNYFFVRSGGALYPCPMIDSSPGNVTTTPIEALLASDGALKIRQRAGRLPECRHCTEPGLERYSLPCEGWTYLSLLPKMGRKRFLDMHHNMGLDKYFT